MDRREIEQVFRERLRAVMDRAGANQAQFARAVGVDRSALSQLLSGDGPRLPRAETLVSIARSQGVSLDWLLGLSAQDRVATQVAPQLEIEASNGHPEEPKIVAWRREAEGGKIRYAPMSLPDLMRTPEVVAYEQGLTGDAPENRIAAMDEKLAYTRRPETDMEVCMPMQRLQDFAAGRGVWSGLSAAARTDQIMRMAALTEEMYPTFRLFLYDGRRAFSAPYTVFGAARAAVYLGEIYVVLNATEHVRALASHFDGLIRRADVTPDRAADWLRGL